MYDMLSFLCPSFLLLACVSILEFVCTYSILPQGADLVGGQKNSCVGNSGKMEIINVQGSLITMQFKSLHLIFLPFIVLLYLVGHSSINQFPGGNAAHVPQLQGRVSVCAYVCVLLQSYPFFFVFASANCVTSHSNSSDLFYGLFGCFVLSNFHPNLRR